jgi:DNA-binding NarL/FixJ family response regulator
MSASNYQRSKQVLQALVQGADPETGSELPGDTVLNRVDVVRALLAAIEALDSVSARALRRAQLPESVGKSWSDEEEQRLKEEFAGGESVPDIATKHGRTVRAIEARLERLGLLRADQRTTDNSFIGGSGAKEGQ